MTPPDSRWTRLTAAARQAADVRDTAAPSGFATRVAARAFSPAAPPPFSALLDRFCWRALGVAALLALLSVAANYSAVSALTSSQSDDDANTNTGEITSEIIDLS